MKIETKSTYIVVETFGTDTPLDNGALVEGLYTELDEAKQALRAEVDQWKDCTNAGDEWRPGYVSPDADRVKWATEYYDKNCLAAWHVSESDGRFEKVEIFFQDTNGNWRKMFS